MFSKIFPSIAVVSLALLFVVAAKAQFQIIGPAPVTPTVARQRLRAALDKADSSNLQETDKQINSLLAWYRDVLDEELIAAWRRGDGANLRSLLEEWADARVAVGVVELSWREQRETKFVPANEQVLGILMSRYPESARSFFEDVTELPGKQLPDLAPPQVETACRILLDLPDIRDFRERALEILPRYGQVTQTLLNGDLQGSVVNKQYSASRWLADLRMGAPATKAAGARPAPAPGPAGVPEGQQALQLLGAKQYAAAKQHASACATAGNAVCMFVLGEVYASPDGPDQDFSEAARWYRLAAEKGNTAGMTALGRLYETGGGVEQNYGESLKWFAKAASLGDATAMYRLASSYEIGKGAAPNRQLAMEWYGKAAAAGSEAAKTRLGNASSEPKTANPAPPKSGGSLLEEAPLAAGQLVNALPDFTARRYINRFTARADRTSWKPLGSIVHDLTFHSGKENYTDSQVTGRPWNNVVWTHDTVAGIASTVNEILRSDTRFSNARAATVGERATLRYDYAVEQLKSEWSVGQGGDTYRVAYAGSIWVDEENHGVLRLEMKAGDLPEDFPLRSSEVVIDYNYIPIGDRKFLLPSVTESIHCLRASDDCLRSTVVFQSYAASGEASPGGAYASGNDSAPAVLHKVAAQMTPQAQNARRGGTVTLSVVVDEQGRVSNPEVIESLGMGLDESAIEAVKKWTFRPGYRNGRPVSMRIKVEVGFRIN